jgi:hypothetical protein
MLLDVVSEADELSLLVSRGNGNQDGFVETTAEQLNTPGLD